MEKVMKCTSCGQVDESHSAYCGKCGRSIHQLVPADSLNKGKVKQ